MSSSTVIRLSGLAALVGYALLAVLDSVVFFAFPDTGATSVAAASNTWFVLNLLEVIALLLGLVGLIGLYTRQIEQAGVLGLVAFLMTFFGIALVFAFVWMQTFVGPVIAQAAPRLLDHPDQNLIQAFTASTTIGELLAVVGWILLGVASLRAGVLPRWAAVLVIAGGVLDILLASGLVGVELPFGGTLGALGLAWMGYAVWSRQQETSEPISPMTAGGPFLASR